MTRWLVDGLIPAGALVVVADVRDGPPEAILASGVDVVLHLGRVEVDDEPVLLTVLWRDGLVPGCEPPAPFRIKFDPARPGLVRADDDAGSDPAKGGVS